jgi:hypothetical protein
MDIVSKKSLHRRMIRSSTIACSTMDIVSKKSLHRGASSTTGVSISNYEIFDLNLVPSSH